MQIFQLNRLILISNFLKCLTDAFFQQTLIKRSYRGCWLSVPSASFSNLLGFFLFSSGHGQQGDALLIVRHFCLGSIRRLNLLYQSCLLWWMCYHGALSDWKKKKLDLLLLIYWYLTKNINVVFWIIGKYQCCLLNVMKDESQTS